MARKSKKVSHPRPTKSSRRKATKKVSRSKLKRGSIKSRKSNRSKVKRKVSKKPTKLRRRVSRKKTQRGGATKEEIIEILEEVLHSSSSSDSCNISSYDSYDEE